MDHQKNPQESKDSSSTMIIQKPLSTVEEMHIDIYTHKIMTYLNKISNLLSSLRTQIMQAINSFFKFFHWREEAELLFHIRVALQQTEID